MSESVYLSTPLTGTTCQDPGSRPAVPVKSANGFAGVLDAKLNESMVKFSGHAMERLKERGINLGETELAKLEGAVSSVAAKGGGNP